jgi:hypothetical protein
MNSYGSFTVTTSVCCCLLVFFLAVSSLEFPVERFLVTYARETLINECDARWTERNEGTYISWVGYVNRKRAGGNPR